MQDLYTKVWATKFAWGEPKHFVTWPESPADVLLNGQTLRTEGRSPAVDFWCGRERWDSGAQNYVTMHNVQENRSQKQTKPPSSGSCVPRRPRERNVCQQRLRSTKAANEIVECITTLAQAGIVHEREGKRDLDTRRLSIASQTTPWSWLGTCQIQLGPGANVD